MFVAAIREAKQAVDRALDGFDASTIPTRDAAGMVSEVEGLVRQLTAARTLLVGRAAECGDLAGGPTGSRSPEGWVARQLGVSSGQAARDISTAERLQRAGGTRDAFLAGEVSAEQARQIAEAVELSPGDEADLLAVAREAPGQVGRRCRDVRVKAAELDGLAKREERHRRARRLRRSETDDLAAKVTMVMPAVMGARFDALLTPWVQRAADRARAEGRHEPSGALDLDGLFLALEAASDPASASDDGGPRPASGPGSGHVRRFGVRPRVLVRVDAAAVRRGHPELGERMDLQLAGSAPVPISPDELGRVLRGDPWVAVVLTEGVDVQRVVLPGRHPSELQRTALDWMHDCCADAECGRWGPLETDHLVPFEASHHTTLSELTRVCGATHDAKTHEGAHLERRSGSHHVVAIPRGDPRHPGDDGPAALRGHAATTGAPLDTSDGRRGERAATRGGQRSLGP